MRKLLTGLVAAGALFVGAQTASAYTEYLSNGNGYHHGCGYNGCGYHRVYGRWHREVWYAPNRRIYIGCGRWRCGY